MCAKTGSTTNAMATNQTARRNGAEIGRKGLPTYDFTASGDR